MKNFVATLIGTLFALSSAGQGTIRFDNRVTGTSTSAVVAPIYDADPYNCFPHKTRNTASGIPAGTQTYNGAPLTGSGFTAGIWARKAGTQDPFVPAGTTPFRVTTSSSLLGSGRFRERLLSSPTLPQIRQFVPTF